MRRGKTFTLQHRIVRSEGQPLYMQLVQGLIHEIERGRLRAGSVLPSSRELAAELDLNRKTVVTAYEELTAQGWLETDGRRGTRVSAHLPETHYGRAQPGRSQTRPLFHFRKAPERPLAIPGGSRIKFDEGSPDGSLFPAEILARSFRQAALMAARQKRLSYRDPRGSELLRDAIAAMLREERGLVVGPQNICVTRGSQAAIMLAARTLTRQGACALAEELTYEPAVQALEGCGLPVHPLRMDEGGLVVDDLEAQCRKHRVAALFLTPHHQFPTTISLAPERRLRIADLARQFGFAIIEDDYDYEFRFGSLPLLPMAAYAPESVVYVGSLSKLLLPALRVGYVAASEEVVAAIAHQVSLTDGMGSTLTEDAVAYLFQDGEVRRHARKAGRIYAERRDAMARAMEEHLGEFAETRLPQGGLAMWLQFHDLEALARLEQQAPGKGISLAASESYRLGPHAPHGLRFGFAAHEPAIAVSAVKTLGRLARG